MTNDRRRVLHGLTALGGAVLLPQSLRSAESAAQRVPGYPFRLGVASGSPTDSSVVLWTRLAPDPARADGAMPPFDWTVRYEIARDQNFRNIVQRGTAAAPAQFAHSVHVEVAGLAPAREYWYRFMVDGEVSATGRTRTLPEPDAKVATFSLAIASCQDYRMGHYAAWRQAAASQPDLILFLGDYIYEPGAKVGQIRAHTGGVCNTLDDFRVRYALYQSDPALQAAHMSAPWLTIWDDHEVQNDYSGVQPGLLEDPDAFLARRAAAYQAWYEHLPVPPSMSPAQGAMRIYDRYRIGRLATVHMLDGRQYRSPEACPQPPKLGGNQVGNECTERVLPERTMLGADQEQWLAQGLIAAPARWTLFGQGTPLAYTDQKPGEGETYWTDAWAGYPAARQRFVDMLRQGRASNPVILSGDIHAFMANAVNAQPDRADTPVVAAEFVTSSISSDALAQSIFDGWRSANPNVQLFDGTRRGYLSITLGNKRLHAEMVGVDDITRADSACRVNYSCIMEAGSPRILPG